MGTNFYARIIPTKERKEHLKSLIDSDNFDEIRSEIQDMYGKDLEYDYLKNKVVGGVVHLGKRSGGWKFLWNPNLIVIRNTNIVKEPTESGYKIKYTAAPDTYQHIYPLTKEGIKNFIDREDIKIFDEYGRELDKNDFFEMAINWTTWNGKEAWDGKSYQEYEASQGRPSKYLPSKDTPYVKALINNRYDVQWPYTDFYSDGLRFATNNVFS